MRVWGSYAPRDRMQSSLRSIPPAVSSSSQPCLSATRTPFLPFKKVTVRRSCTPLVVSEKIFYDVSEWVMMSTCDSKKMLYLSYLPCDTFSLILYTYIHTYIQGVQ